MIRGRRVLRWLILGLLLGAGLTATIDIVALTVFESRGSAQLAAGLAAERATLDLGGWPLLPGFVAGRLDNVEADVIGSSAKGLRVERLHVAFEEARFSPGPTYDVIKSRFANRTTVRGTNVIGRVEITEGDLAEFLRSRDGRVAAVRIDGSGVGISFNLEDGEISPPARYLPDVIDRRIVLRLLGAGDLPRNFRQLVLAIETVIDLPRIPSGLQPDVGLGNGVFQVEVSGPAVELTIGEGGGRALGGLWPWNEEGSG